MSATIIDSLVVMLGLDSKDLETKSPRAKKHLKDVEDQGLKTEKAVEGLSRALTGFLAIIGGTMAIKAFVSDFIDANAQLDRFSRNLGLSVSTISAWSNATEKLGGSSQALQGTLDMLSKSQTQLMLTGESSLIPYMSALGISLADTAGKARPVTDILLDLSDRFSHMDRTTANNLGRMMGLDQGTLNLLLQGRKELELEIRRQKEQNIVTAAQAAEATKLQKSIVGVKQTFSALGRALFMDAAPALERLLIVFQRVGDWIYQNRSFVEDFLKVLAVGLAAIAIATLPINLTAVAVLALAAAIALLWQDYQVWKAGGKSFIDWGPWVSDIQTVMKWIDALIAKINELMGKFDQWTQSKTGAKASTMIKSGASAMLYGVGAAIGVAGLKGPEEKAGNKESLAGTVRAMKLQSYFESQGWSKAQAAGIVANLMSESGGRIDATGDGGSAYGIAQWHKDRQEAFKKWAGFDIHDPRATLAKQAAFVQYELTQGSEKAAGDKLRGATSADQAGSIVSRSYERPADAAGEAARRGSYASSLAGVPGASSLAANAPQTGSGGPASVDRSDNRTIGPITVITQATDAPGIARDLGQALDYQFAAQANGGTQ